MVVKEWMIANPKISVVAFSFLVTLVMTLITKKFTNQSRMKELKEIQKKCNIEWKELRKNNPDEKRLNELQKKMMECNMELMKHSFKPILITFIPLLGFFWWIKGIYTAVLPGWLWWYIGAGIASSIILRKVLDVA